MRRSSSGVRLMNQDANDKLADEEGNTQWTPSRMLGTRPWGASYGGRQRQDGGRAAAPRAEGAPRVVTMCATALTAKHNPPPGTRGLSLWQKARGEGLRGGGARARPPAPLRYRRLSRAPSSRSLSRRAALSRTNRHALAAAVLRLDASQIAAMNGHEAIVRRLLEAGADKDAKSKEGFMTARRRSTRHGRRATRRSSRCSAARRRIRRQWRRQGGESGRGAVQRARDGKTEDVRRLLAQKAPLEWSMCATALPQSTTRRPAHALSLCGKRRCGEGLRGGGARARAARSSPATAASLSRAVPLARSRHAPLSLAQMRARACCGRTGAWGLAYRLSSCGGERPRGDRAAAARGRGGQGGEGEPAHAFINAAHNGHEAIVRLLLEAGANKEAGCGRATAPHRLRRREARRRSCGCCSRPGRTRTRR